MNLMEYLNRLSKEGTYVALPTEIWHQKQTEESCGDGAGGKSGTVCIKYTSVSLNNERQDFKLLQQICLRILNTSVDNASLYRLWKALMQLVRKDFRNGEYTELSNEFKEWVMQMSDSLCASLTEKMLVERNIPGARYWLETLKNRMAAWQKQVHVDVPAESAEDKSIHITIGSF